MLWCLTASLAAWRDANPTMPTEQATKISKAGATDRLNDATKGERGWEWEMRGNVLSGGNVGASEGGEQGGDAGCRRAV